jgi:Na+/H+ antiporter NhaC
MEWVGLIIVLMLYYSILGGAKLFKVFNSLGNAVFILAVIWGRYYKIPAVSAFMRQRTLREAIVILFVVWSFSFALEIFVGEVILEKPFMRKHMDKRLSI